MPDPRPNDNTDIPAEGPDTPQPPAVLHYAVPGQDGGIGHGVTVAECANEAEAELVAGELAAEGIPSEVVNQIVTATIGLYLGGSQIRVRVAAGDVERAAQVLRRRAAEDEELEPVDDLAAPDGVAPPAALDEQGRPIRLAAAGAFETLRLMNEAGTVLAASRIRIFPPTLVPRGNRPKGQGPRFVLRVPEEDADRARSILEDAAAEAGEDDDPRCPECNSWRVFKAGGLLADLGRLFGIGTGRPRPRPGDLECLACRHVGPKEQFMPSERRRD